MAVKDLGIVTAYGYAKAGGYTGTEQEFTALLGDLALTVEDLENLTVSVTTLEPSQHATASYNNGVLSLGIPKGRPGEVLEEQWLYSFPVGTASGAIASFNDGAGDVPVKTLVAQIEPVQSGSGDPSPTNVRAIAGHTSANVTVAGKNLISFKSLLDNWGSGYTDLGGGSYNVTSTGTGYREPFRFASKDIDVTLSGEITQLSGSAGWRLQLLNSSGEVVATLGAGSTTLSGKGCKLRLNYTTGGTGANYKNIQVELGTAATGYEPYKGTTYPVSFGSAGTVYGGTVDVVTGVLTVTHKAVDLGSLTWTLAQASGTNYFRSAVLSGAKITANGQTSAMCSAYKPISGTSLSSFLSQNNVAWTAPSNISTSNPYACIRDDRYSDAAAFKTAVSGVLLVYELATPQTYQLTPPKLATLLGQNNVWADSGDVTMTYRKDPTIALANLEALLENQ